MKKQVNVVITVNEVVINDETNVEKDIVVGTQPSDYAKFFNETCISWTKSPEYNLMFLRQQQRYANDMLKNRGHIFLNEVYDLIGLPRTKAGAVVGWVYNKENPVGDNFVDFGIYDLHDEKKQLFVNGGTNSIWLDFNVDGCILDKI